ncbi:hypothetical protein QFC24_004369 [Naganishia onofrii]|uniref:Uncharacterized protein n=1 Tax=Naganishia onofrii TaxID=1851511 RepID=A0ACC2XGH9_9TREE|nr:hypothetical protein QFC24_004369 [Naganishia onofrii]
MTIPTVKLGDIHVNKFFIAPGSGFLHSKKDYAVVMFDLDADLSPLFESWNTKQLYVSLTADYNNTKEGSSNSIVIWDKIIPRTPPTNRRSKASRNSKPSFVESYFPQSDFELPTLNEVLARPGVPKAAKLKLKNARSNHAWKAPSGAFRWCCVLTQVAFDFPRDFPSTRFTLRYDIMPYVGFLVPGVAGQARNPAYKNTTGSALTEWDWVVPKVKKAGVGR